MRRSGRAEDKAVFLELLLSATQDGIVDWNMLSGSATYNPRWQLLLGFDDNEFEQQRRSPELWHSLIHPEDYATTMATLRDHLEHGWPFTLTVRMRHRSAGYRHILCRGTSLRDEASRPTRMVIIFSDIDDKIRGEGRQRALISAVPDTLLLIRADGTIAGIKPGRERDGSPFAALREGDRLADSFPEARIAKRLVEALQSDPATSSLPARPIQITSKGANDCTLHHEVRVVRSGEDETVCIVRDVTEQRELESRLLESQKLGAIGQLAAGVAHEINTPMQFIGDNLHFAKAAIDDLLGLLDRFKAAALACELEPLGSVGLQALRQAEVDADFEYARAALPTTLSRSLEGVERVTNIVRAMKSFAHPGADQFTPADLKGLIESTVIVATNEWKYVANVELSIEPDLPPVPCIAGELNQVILNLLVNAAHAIADVVGQTGRKGLITITVRCDGAHAEIRVRDTGTGIPEHVRPRVFEPFFTTKEVGKGTGQGLAMAYNCIVKRHRGSISFETELGAGTTFLLRLPLTMPIRHSMPTEQSLLPGGH